MQTQGWKRFLRKPSPPQASSATSMEDFDEVKRNPEKSSLGVLNDKETDEVPGRTVESFPPGMTCWSSVMLLTEKFWWDA